MPLFPDCTGSSWVCFAKNKSHRWFQKTCLVHYTSSRPKFSWFLEGLSPLFFKQNQTWVPPGMETACRNLSPFVPLLIPGPTRNQYSFDFSLPFSYFFLQIHCWLGWVVKIHMTPEYFLKRLVWFMNLSGKRSSMLIEAFFTLSLSLFLSCYLVFLWSPSFQNYVQGSQLSFWETQWAFTPVTIKSDACISKTRCQITSYTSDSWNLTALKTKLWY